MYIFLNNFWTCPDHPCVPNRAMLKRSFLQLFWFPFEKRKLFEQHELSTLGILGEALGTSTWRICCQNLFQTNMFLAMKLESIKTHLGRQCSIQSDLIVREPSEAVRAVWSCPCPPGSYPEPSRAIWTHPGLSGSCPGTVRDAPGRWGCILFYSPIVFGHIWPYLYDSTPGQPASPDWQGQASTLKTIESCLPERATFWNDLACFSKRYEHPLGASFSLISTLNLDKKASKAYRYLNILKPSKQFHEALVCIRFCDVHTAFGSKVGVPPRRPQFENRIFFNMSLSTFERQKLQNGQITFLEDPHIESKKLV